MSIFLNKNNSVEFFILRGLGHSGALEEMQDDYLTALGYQGSLAEKLDEFHRRSIIGQTPIDRHPWSAHKEDVVFTPNSFTTIKDDTGLSLPVEVGKWYRIESDATDTGRHFWLAEGVGTVYEKSMGTVVFQATSPTLLAYAVEPGTVEFTRLVVREI